MKDKIKTGLAVGIFIFWLLAGLGWMIFQYSVCRGEGLGILYCIQHAW